MGGVPRGRQCTAGTPTWRDLLQPLPSPTSASPHRVACRGPRRASQGMWQGEAPRCGTCGTDAAITPGQQTPVTHSASLMDSRGQYLKESFAPGESGLLYPKVNPEASFWSPNIASALLSSRAPSPTSPRLARSLPPSPSSDPSLAADLGVPLAKP